MALKDKAKGLVVEMMKKGSDAPKEMEKPMLGEEMDDESMEPSDDGMGPVMQDIDAMVPGLGKLVHELIERCMAEKE